MINLKGTKREDSRGRILFGNRVGSSFIGFGCLSFRPSLGPKLQFGTELAGETQFPIDGFSVIPIEMEESGIGIKTDLSTSLEMTEVVGW